LASCSSPASSSSSNDFEIGSKETKQQTILNLLAEEQQRQKDAGDRI
jgi:hypothetical protein